jgi:hypothetical protein
MASYAVIQALARACRRSGTRNLIQESDISREQAIRLVVVVETDKRKPVRPSMSE